MGGAAKIGKRAIWLANAFVNIFVLLVILLLLVFGCYAIWDSSQVYNAADAAHYEIYKPSAQNESFSFQDLQAINPEVFGWLSVYGTHIDYPLVQGKNNFKYINTNAKGNYSLSGAIFLDSRCERDFGDFSSIFYGHHMEKQAMFGEIGLFAKEDYFQARKYGMLYYNGLEHGLEFFAFVHTGAYDYSVFRTNITEQEDRQAYLDRLLQLALYIREDVTVTVEDKIVLLSTCSARSTNGRDILLGKITDTLYADPFIKKEKDAGGAALAADALLSLWERMPAGAKIAVICLPHYLLLILLCLLIKSMLPKKSGGK